MATKVFDLGAVIVSPITKIEQWLANQLWEGFNGLMLDLFIPDSEYFNQQNQQLLQTISSKLGVGDITELTFNTPSTPSEPPTIPFLMGTTISFAWFAPYVGGFRIAISSVLVLITFMYLLKNIKGFFS